MYVHIYALSYRISIHTCTYICTSMYLYVQFYVYRIQENENFNRDIRKKNKRSKLLKTSNERYFTYMYIKLLFKKKYTAFL